MQPDSVPVPFVVGAPRSGTTLVRAMLDSHSTLAIPPESHFVPRLVGTWRYAAPVTPREGAELFLRTVEAEPRFRLWNLPSDSLRAAVVQASSAGIRDLSGFVRVLFATYAIHAGKMRWGDKTPEYATQVPLLASLLPEAVFVHVLRDGRDCALAYLRTGIGPTTISKAATMWSRNVEHARAAGRRLDAARYLEVRYEDLVREPASELRRICDAISLDFEPGMLEYWRDSDRIGAASLTPDAHASVARPPTPGLRDWRTEMNPADVRVFEGRVGPTLVECGYPLTGTAGFTRYAHRARHLTRRTVSNLRHRTG